MIVSNKTVYHEHDMQYGNLLNKNELCFRQFKAYLLWAKGMTNQHCNYVYTLQKARELYELYLHYKKIEEEPTEIIRPLGVAA